ncbi:MAG TPA: beta-Ala-His dipeptidase, partial [Anaerolineae bacterium]|nr:beta-Ala-His dipeptidase [Anaerolineae bacterium]
GVEVYWGVGFGGACPTETVPVQVSGVELPACHATDDDGAEVWNLIGYEVNGGNSFSLLAYTSDAEPASHDLVLQVLAALTFMEPAETEAGVTIEPLPVEVCNGQAQAMAHFLDVLEVTQSEESLTDYVTGATGVGCQATVTGTGEQFESPDAVVATLGDMLEEQGWTEDPMLAAGGPTGMGEGFRKGDELCIVVAQWWPDDSANCPPDQPISACEVTPAQQLYTVTLNCGVEISQEEAAETPAQIANPASQNCLEQGGMLAIEERGDGGQFGVCTFEDNRQCEEWALLRGDCPLGGLKVTGYATPAARYCAITGGTYTITANSGADDEQGACTLPDGGLCDAWDYYNGLCDASTAAPAEPASAMGASPAVTAARVSTATMAPLKDAVATMEPQAVWQNFYDLTQVPRPSHHEEQVAAFLVQFGEDLGLETLVDGVGNVLIRKPASPGLEDVQGVVLQAHMDMVPQKTPESDHDFLLDPIDAYMAGEFVVADGTTLGADDGIGVAMAMAILQEQDTPLGPIEALFTINEEDGMDGALGLEPGWLQGSILINLDSEEEGVFTIGSAGGEYVTIDTPYAEVAAPDATTAYSVTVSGLQGGHSGVDIDKGRGHATKLLVRLLSPAAQQFGLRLASIAGGDASNAITREATALVVVPEDQVDAFLQVVQQFDAIVKSELSIADPGVTAQATPATLPAQVMDETVQRLLLDALYATPQGVLRMSDAVPGLVETSTNMGIVEAEAGKLTASLLPRSSVDTALDDVGQMIASVWDMAGVPVDISGRYSGWNPNPESPIVLLMQEVYQEQTGQEAVVSAVHAGLECGTIVSKYPGMDAISIGPTLHDVHTPNERLEIATVPELMDLLMETLQRIAEPSVGDSGQPTATAEAAAPAGEAAEAAISATQVITYTPGPPTGEPQAGSCWTNSLAVWRADAWRCFVGNSIHDPCFAVDGDVICGASPVTTTVSFALELTEPLPAPTVPDDTSGHAWLVELPDGTVCEFATGATGGVDGERINYLCPSPDPDQRVAILGDLQPDAVWMAWWAVLAGGMPDLSVVESAMTPVRTVWR